MMNLQQLKFTRQKESRLYTVQNSTLKLFHQEIEGEFPVRESPRKVVGIDPGKNFGVSVIGKGCGDVFHGILDDTSRPLRECAFELAELICMFEDPQLVVLEGASYGDRFGQVKLAEVRCGFALGASESHVPVLVVPPKTPRKAVFGSGDLGAWDVWPTVNHNAADSLCLALYPFYREKK